MAEESVAELRASLRALVTKTHTLVKSLNDTVDEAELFTVRRDAARTQGRRSGDLHQGRDNE